MNDAAKERVSAIICGASWSYLIDNPTHVDFDDEGNARIWRGQKLLATICSDIFEDEEIVSSKGLD